MFAFAKFVMYAGTTVCLFGGVFPQIQSELPPALAELNRQTIFVVGCLMVAAGYISRRLFDPRTN